MSDKKPEDQVIQVSKPHNASWSEMLEDGTTVIHFDPPLQIEEASPEEAAEMIEAVRKHDAECGCEEDR